MGIQIEGSLCQESMEIKGLVVHSSACTSGQGSCQMYSNARRAGVPCLRQRAAITVWCIAALTSMLRCTCPSGPGDQQCQEAPRARLHTHQPDA